MQRRDTSQCIKGLLLILLELHTNSWFWSLGVGWGESKSKLNPQEVHQLYKISVQSPIPSEDDYYLHSQSLREQVLALLYISHGLRLGASSHFCH